VNMSSSPTNAAYSISWHVSGLLNASPINLKAGFPPNLRQLRDANIALAYLGLYMRARSVEICRGLHTRH